MRKKLLVFLLAMVAGVGSLFAESGTCGKNLTWNLTDGVLTISGTGVMRDYSYYTSTPWYSSHSLILSVIISDGVTSIGEYAFYACTGLTSVTIPNSVTSIGDDAFGGCTGLTSVMIPNSVTSIGNSAFSRCSSLTSVTIPNNVTSIEDYAFSGCTGLTSINVASDNSNYCSVDGVLFNKDKTTLIQYPGGKQGAYTIPNSVTSIGDRAFHSCSGLTSVTIPNSITSIGDLAFYYCSGLTSPVYTTHIFAYMPTSYSGAYTIPDGIESIAGGAFAGCKGLTSVTIPNSVTSIGGAAFEGCSGLTTVTIPNSVTSIGERAFRNCSGLTSVTIPNSVTSIGSSAFSGCTGLTLVTIPNSVTSIGSSAFSGCTGLTSVTIPNSVTSIGDYAFNGCDALTSVTIPNSVSSIGTYAFSNCTGLTSPVYNAHVFAYLPTSYSGAYSIPDGIESLAGAAFYDCSGLTSIEIPNSVTSIGRSAFYGCSSLTSVVIPNSVTSIGGYAFHECTGLTSVIWNAKNCSDFNFSMDVGDIPFFQSQVTSFTFGEEVEHIPAFLCAFMHSLTSVTIPNSVTSIGSRAFEECSNLTSVTLNSNAIASKNYSYYSNLKNIFGTQVTEYIIGESVTSIGDMAFYGCSGLTSVVWNAKNCSDFEGFEGDAAPFYNIRSQITFLTFGEEVEHIPAYLCYGMTHLTSMVIPKSVTSIGVGVFFGCSGLISPLYNDHVFAYLPATYSGAYTIPDGIESLAGGAFAGCSGLTSVTIPNSVTSIGDYTFSNCSNLTSITDEAATPPSCGENVFYNVPKTIPLYVPAESIDDYKAADQWKDFGNNILPIQTTAIDQITIDQTSQEPIANSQKLIKDGQLLILRDSHTYTLTGQEVK